MNNSFLLFGSYAFDTIMNHHGLFEKRILSDSLSCINVAFGINEIKDEFGGTAGNIAYNSSLLYLNPMLIGNVGNDFNAYKLHLKEQNIDDKHLVYHEDKKTAHAYILTDEGSNQITSFYSGAMNNSVAIPVTTPDIWHIAPEIAENMVVMIKEAILLNKKYFIDPGQALPSILENYDKEYVLYLFEKSEGLFVNEYEMGFIENHFKLSKEDLKNKGITIINTLGAKGVHYISKDLDIVMPVYKANQIVDPTGCGDSFRAGFLHQYLNNQSIENCLKLGMVMGSFCIEQHGGQNHKPTIQEIYARFNSV